MPQITINVEPQYDTPIIRIEENGLQITQIVRRVMPDSRVWDTTEYTFWETIPPEKEVPVYDEKGDQTGSETIPNPETWYPLSKTHATNLKNVIAAIKSALDPVEAGKISDKASLESVIK